MASTIKTLATRGLGQPDPLASYAENAPSPTMRALAKVAIWRGYRQESLAKALAQRPGLSGIQAGNVGRHFQSRAPRQATLDDYAAVLDITDEQLYVIEHGVLPPARERHWESEVLRALAIDKYIFTPAVIAAVEDALRADPAVRSRALAAYVRSEWWRPIAWDLSDPRVRSKLPLELYDFAQALLPRLDLRDFLRVPRPSADDALADAYRLACVLYKSRAKALAFVDVCAAVFRFDGFDTDPMYGALHDLLRDLDDAPTATEKDGQP
jgi:hypothetical protein